MKLILLYFFNPLSNGHIYHIFQIKIIIKLRKSFHYPTNIIPYGICKFIKFSQTTKQHIYHKKREVFSLPLFCFKC